MAMALLKAKTRNTDPQTSRAAAASVKGMTAKRRAVLALFKVKRSMTDEELVVEYSKVRFRNEWPDQSESGLRTRRSELVTLGMLTQGKTLDGKPRVVVGGNGRKRIVWTLAS